VAPVPACWPKIGTEVAHVTRDSHDQKVKGQGHQAALFTAVLTRQAAAAVSVGTYWPWEPTATLRPALCRHGRLGAAGRFGAHRGRRGAGAYRGGRPPTACYFDYTALIAIFYFSIANGSGILLISVIMPCRGALSDDARLTSVCLTYVAYIELKSKTERPRKTKIGKEVARVTRDSDTTFKVKRSKVKVTCEARAYCGGLPHSLLNLILQNFQWQFIAVRNTLVVKNH